MKIFGEKRVDVGWGGDDNKREILSNDGERRRLYGKGSEKWFMG